VETERINVSTVLTGVRRLFLDTAPVIYHVEGVSAYQPLTDVIFEAISNGAVETVTSSVTLAESLGHSYQHGDLRLVERFRNVITADTHTSYVGVDSVAESAAELRARYNLSLTDAFQVAAALASSCEAFLTNDGALKRVAEFRVLVLDELLKSFQTSP
jgi:predicted nucleic acid-binding protein